MMRYSSTIKINDREISIAAPTYFIADLASNHNGDLNQAKELIAAAKESGADAVKFQHFLADKIVSDHGFKHLGAQLGHQSAWKKTVYEVYRECECNRAWTQELVDTARNVGIDFLTTPYDVDIVEEIDPYVPAYKIGSGDITWIEFIELIAQKNKPVMLATGAANFVDVQRAVDAVLTHNPTLVLMQCNTNYTGSIENFKHINLNVLRAFAIVYPNMLLGLSDHTLGHSTVLGAITLGARVIEKHFTLDNSLVGPDHAFSMNPSTWREMLERSRELEAALGNGIKRIERNELDTVILQRRCLRLKRSMNVGDILSANDIEILRPAPSDALYPYQIDGVIGRRLNKDKALGDYIKTEDLI